MNDVCPHGNKYFEMDYGGKIYPALNCDACIAERKRKAERAELVRQFMVAEITADLSATVEQILSRAVNDADAFLKWRDDQ